MSCKNHFKFDKFNSKMRMELKISMESVGMTMIIVALIGISMGNQCPSGRTENVLARLRFDSSGHNSSGFYLQDIEYDSETNDYFYLGETSDSHCISRLNSRGDIIWSKAYSGTSVDDTLEYSPTNQTLHYLIRTDSVGLMKINSSDGTLLTSFQISDISMLEYTKCSLSIDSGALF